MDFMKHLEAFGIFMLGLVSGLLFVTYIRPVYTVEFLFTFVFLGFICFLTKGLIQSTIRGEVAAVQEVLDEMKAQKRRMELRVAGYSAEPEPE